MRAIILASASILALTVSETAANAQSALSYRNWDENGVDVVRGDFNFFFQEASIGSGKARLDLVRVKGNVDQPFQWDRRYLTRNLVGGTVITQARKPDDTYFNFTGSMSDAGDGSTIAGLGGELSDIRDSDGVLYRYSNPLGSDAGVNSLCSNVKPPPCELPLTSITYPDGTVITLQIGTWRNTTTGIVDTRVLKVSNNFGYELRFTYACGGINPNQSGPSGPPAGWWQKVTTTLRRSGVVQSTISYAYPTPGTVEITDPVGQVWTVTTNSIKKPGETTPSFTVTGNPTVTSVTNAGVTTTYNRVVSGSTVTLTKTDPLGKQTVITSNSNIGRITSIKNPLPNSTTTYGYDSSGRLTSVTLPEGNGVDYVLDARGNATQIKQRPKPDVINPFLTTIQTFPATCTNQLTCNKPTQITDPGGNSTDYTYDSVHGGVLTVTQPAPTTGAVRPQKRYSYTPFSGIYLPTGISECQTLATCTGAADEVKTTIGYDAYANSTSVSKGSGNGSLTATSTMTYDGMGNLLTLDGPLSGTDDTTRYRYDAARRIIGVVGPDPDGTGVPKPHRAIKNTYDGAGRLTKVERGTVSSQSDPDWALFATAETLDIGLDTNGRQKTQKLSGSSGAEVLTQISYDALGRTDCVAVRMNKTAFASLPASACSLGSQGSFGPDRISKNVYDDAGQITEQQVAVGTAEAATEQLFAYTNNGRLLTLKDGENNLTTYEYDRYDRLKKTRFPVPSPKGSNASSTTDYEELGYDTRSNVVSFRNRANETIGFTYDNLSRAKLKDLPAAELDVTYAYDNLGRLTSATQTGHSLSFTYDALSRQLTEVSPLGTVSMQYDLASRRTQLSTSIGYALNYQRLTTGEIAAILDGASNPQANFTYDNLGRRTGMQRYGIVSTYNYDPISRLLSLSQAFPNSANNLTIGTITYNPASQIISQIRSNDAYSWTGHGSGSTASTANGLNQLASIAGSATQHDTRGNLTLDPTTGKDYGYNSENKLISASNSGVTLSYDPLGRLFEYAVGTDKKRFLYATGESGIPEIITEYNGSNALTHHYVYGPGVDEPIMWSNWTSGTGVIRLLVPDERGSIVAVADTSGNIVAQNRYDEFGKLQTTSANNAGRLLYTGQMWMPEIGLYYYKSRMYSPALGRFLQPDPIGYYGGPNLYAYVLNDPINFNDPLGLQVIPPDPVVGCRLGKEMKEGVCVPIPKPDKPTPLGPNPGSIALPGGMPGGSKVIPKKKLSKCIIDFLGSQGVNTAGLGDVTFYGDTVTANAVYSAMGNPAITIGRSIHVHKSAWDRVTNPSDASATYWEEIVHVTQWRGYAGTASFGTAYLGASLIAAVKSGNAHNNAFEQSAIAAATALLNAYNNLPESKKCPEG